LETTAEWFRQLWGESLGKRRPDGRPAGQTPVRCVGSTDQHSMQQLLVEGPPDKAALVLAAPCARDAAVPADAGEPVAGRGLLEVLEAMRRATSGAWVGAGCPVATLTLKDRSERSVGALLMTLMLTTVLAGRLLEVDPFGQPGVEAAKAAAAELLRDPGGERDREISAALGEGSGVVVD
ncbi:MAG: glucose-6-phosphate isomerase, partial [Planctomycetota bacterium]